MTTTKTFAQATCEDELMLSKRIIERFIKSCSHDLKAPLCTIEGLLSIASKYVSVEEIKECHRMIYQSVDRMKQMLISLEEYTQHLHRELQRNEISASKLIGEILAENQNDIREGGVEFAINVDQPVKWISDEYCTYIILQNVIRNAVLFYDGTKALRKVSIGIAVNERFVAVQIVDNGIGISPEQQSKLFEPFHRASNLKSGLGLGLFLVKGMVSKLCANIRVSSQEEVGTAVSLMIPNNLLT